MKTKRGSEGRDENETGMNETGMKTKTGIPGDGAGVKAKRGITRSGDEHETGDQNGGMKTERG